jgi:hypothetical protein
MRGATTVAHLTKAASQMLAEGQHDEAATLLRSALNLDPFSAQARAMLTELQDAERRALYADMPATSIVEHARRVDEKRLPPRERRLHSLVNGRWDVSALAATSGLGELETLRALRRLMHAGTLRLRTSV